VIREPEKKGCNSLRASVFASRVEDSIRERKKKHHILTGKNPPLPREEHQTASRWTGLPRAGAKRRNLGHCRHPHQSGSFHPLPLRTWRGADGIPVHAESAEIAWVTPRDHLWRNARFPWHFWRQFQNALGTKESWSSPHHPQTDGQSERTLQTLEDMLRACALTMSGARSDHLHLAEFAYNNCYHASIGMAPFSALYGVAEPWFVGYRRSRNEIKKGGMRYA